MSTKQKGLIITPGEFVWGHGLILASGQEPEITTDDIEVAQFLYLLIHNEKLRKVIDTITSKVVLILGRFTPERKAVLDALRDEVRNATTCRSYSTSRSRQAEQSTRRSRCWRAWHDLSSRTFRMPKASYRSYVGWCPICHRFRFSR